MGDAEELEAEARAAEERLRRQREAERRAESQAEARRQRSLQAGREADARAPISGWSEIQAEALFSGLPLALMVAMWWWQAPPPTWLWGVVGLWALWLSAALLRGALWRRLLPYELLGYEHIAGHCSTPDGEAPILGFRVTVRLAPDAPAEAERAVQAALRLLVSTANARLAGDPDYREATRWTSTAQGAAGEGSFGFYRTGLWRRWLSGPMRRAARGGSVVSVRVEARFTDKHFTLPSD